MMRISWLALSCLLLTTTSSLFSQEWTQIQKATADVREMDSKFGNTVDIDGETAIIGTQADDLDVNGENELTNAGAAYLHQRLNGQWQQAQKVVASDRDANANFGFDVGISDSLAVVGANSEAYDANGENFLDAAGAAYFFELNPDGQWVETQKVVASDREDFNYFGSAVAISGNVAVVAAPNNGTDDEGSNFMMNSGSVYVFERDTLTGVWTEMNKVTAIDRGNLDFFGASVDVSNGCIVVGSRGDDEDETFSNYMIDAGSAYIVRPNFLGDWMAVQKIAANDREPMDWFGISVAMDEDKLVVGARQEDESATGTDEFNDAGSVYVFEENEDDLWIQSQKLTPADRAEGDLFGYAVDIQGELLLVSSRSDDEDAMDMNYLDRSGSAYLFEKDDTETWMEVTKIVAADRGEQDYFGTSVALTTETLLVGARGEDDDINGENPLDDSGSVYYYALCAESESTIQVSLCPGDSMLINGEYIMDEGLYTTSFSTNNGCDSVVHFDVQLLTAVGETYNLDLCEGDSILLGEEWILEGGSYLVSEQNLDGCFVENTYDVTLNASYEIFDEYVICDGEEVLIDGISVSEAGTYTSEHLTTLGCDSVVHSTVIVNPVPYVEEIYELCDGDSIIIGDDEYFDDFQFEELGESVLGCDSLTSHNGFFYPNYSTLFEEQICEGESLMFEGMEYTETGEYMLSYQSIHGCDSLIFLDLTVSALPEVDLGEDQIICDTIEFYLTAEAGFVNYEWSTGDDGQSILIQTTDEYALWVTDEMGCTGSDTIYIEVQECTNISEWTGFEEVLIYPNPTPGLLQISHADQLDWFRLFNSSGQLVKEVQINDKALSVDLSSLPTGQYIIELVSNLNIYRSSVVISR